MSGVEDEESKFSAVLGLDVTQTAQIPKDIRKILLQRFEKGYLSFFIKLLDIV